MQFTQEQLAVLVRHRYKRSLGARFHLLLWLVECSAVIAGLFYITYLEPSPHKAVSNIVQFLVILSLVMAWIYAVATILGVSGVTWLRDQSRVRKTKGIHDAFVNMQRSGLSLPGTDWGAALNDILHFLLSVALGACGWNFCAFAYFAALLVKRGGYNFARQTAAEYFSALTPEEIAAFEPQPNPLQNIVDKSNFG